MNKREFIFKILELIDFQENRENFIDEFIETIKKRAAARAAANQIDLGNNNLVEKYLDEEFLILIQEWLVSIKSSLNTDQIQAIQDLANQPPAHDSL